MNGVARDVHESRRGLVYQRRGSGPVVVLVHGWCLDRTVWLYQEQGLIEAGFSVISVDLAGYGASNSLSGPFGLDRHGADVADLLDELDLRDAVVVGFAFGGAVLLSLPDYERVAGAVVIGIPSAAGAPYPKMRRSMMRDWPRFARASAGAICAQPQSEESLAWLGDVFARTPLNSALAGVDVLAEFEPLEQPAGGRSTVLFVHGRDDTIVAPSVSEAAAAHYTDAAVRIVDESGHFVPWDQPTELTGIIAEFARGRA